MARWLVTGGAGFIGSNIIEELINRGEQVWVLDNFSTGKRENIEPFLDKIDLMEGDLKDLDTVKTAVNGIDYILHQGALPSVQRSIEDPMATNCANICGTLNVLLAARDARVKRVVYASSSAVYGETPVLPKREDMKPQPLSPYAISKLTAEYYCQIFYKLDGLETVCLRYFNVFGPRQDPESEYAAVIPKFIRLTLEGKQPEIYGDGKQSRDFTFVKDVVEANLLASQAKNIAGGVFNIACGRRITLLDFVELLNRLLDIDIVPIFTAPRPGDIKHSLADISRAKELLSYSPKFSFEEGLKETIQWFKKTV